MISFSIIIPLYNKEKAIASTMSSVLNQTYRHFEIVVVDDGSKDKSSDIVNSFEDERIHYFRKDNGGVSSARNYGIQHASYEWLLFLDADDMLEVNALKTFVELMNQFPHHLVYLGNMKLSNCLRCKTMKEFGCVSDNPFKDWMKMRLAPEMGTFVMHNSLVERVGLFDERISCFEDLEFTSRIMDRESIVYTSRPVKTYQEQYSTLSVIPHPVEKEFAYYIDKNRIQGSHWKKMVLAYNVWDTCRHHKNAKDMEGVHFYWKRLRTIFPCYITMYFFYREIRTLLGDRMRMLKRG